MDYSLLVLWLCGAFAATGGMQWIKGIVPKSIPIPTWVWGFLLPVLCVLWAASPLWLQGAWMVLALSQLGYENIVQLIKKKLDMQSNGQ